MSHVLKKPPFKLPDFYGTWPARLNPHLEHARRNSKAWAYRMGILGSEKGKDDGDARIWSEARFDAMDFAFFTAYTHPDVPAAELELLSEWYIWGWFVDDYCPQIFEKSGDLAGARDYIARLMEFMPLGLTAPLPEPTHPVERAVADLWPRTAPSMSVEWRRRYVADLQNLAEAYLREVASAGRDRDRILDPVEFVMLRREVGGIFWSSDLVEHSLNAEIPARIYNTRPIRVLRETFADAAGLRNDIISYLIDIEEGKINNGVVVMKYFLGCELQRAVDVVNDQVTSRLQQLENTASTELAPLFDEHELHPLERQQVLRYVKALQDWLAGDLQWELQPGGRYLPATSEGSRSNKSDSGGGLPLGPKGLGTSAARIPSTLGALGPQRIKNFSYVPYAPVKPVTLPKFYMPFPSKVNSHLGSVRRYSKQWAHQMGMLDSLPGFPGICICDERRFDLMDLPLCGALIHPEASESELHLTSDLLFWGTYADDYFLEMFGHTGNMVGAKAFHARLQAFMPDDPSLSPLAPINPVERGLADIWKRVAHSKSMAARRRFRLDIQRMFDSWLWELANRIPNRIPDPVDYIEMRRLTFGAEIMLNASWLEDASGLPIELVRSPQIRGLLNAAADYIGPLNDIFSYLKEVQYEGELNHGVLVIQRFLDIDAQQAVGVLNELMTARMRQFEYIAAKELPALADDFNLNKEEREHLERNVQRLQYCASGLLKWHLASGRYKEAEAVNASNLSRLRGRPTGLGTSAMHIATLFGGSRSGSSISK